MHVQVNKLDFLQKLSYKLIIHHHTILSSPQQIGFQKHLEQENGANMHFLLYQMIIKNLLHEGHNTINNNGFTKIARKYLCT